MPLRCCALKPFSDTMSRNKAPARRLCRAGTGCLLILQLGVQSVGQSIAHQIERK